METASKLRESLGEAAVRIDHIGSTSVIGLDAKPIIDIQISVSDFNDISSYRHKIERVGFVLRDENPDRTKRYFREVPGTRRTHIHVRQAGSLAEQVTLVFRDYLRTHPEDGLRYSREKHQLMKLYKRLFKKSSFDHEVNQEAIRHRILNSAGPSGAHVPQVRSAPQSLTSFNLLGAENLTF